MTSPASNEQQQYPDPYTPYQPQPYVYVVRPRRAPLTTKQIVAIVVGVVAVVVVGGIGVISALYAMT